MPSIRLYYCCYSASITVRHLVLNVVRLHSAYAKTVMKATTITRYQASLTDRTPEIAEESAAKVYELYNGYKDQADFVGMDMARKFLQMGYTRAMRYAKHKGGRKYESNHELLPETVNEEKADCAQVILQNISDQAGT